MINIVSGLNAITFNLVWLRVADIKNGPHRSQNQLYVQLDAKYGIIIDMISKLYSIHTLGSDTWNILQISMSNENAHLIDRIGSNANTLHHDINWRSGIYGNQ